MPQPSLSLLDPDLIAWILDEAFQLISEIGVRVSDNEARRLLQESGAALKDDIVHIPEQVVRRMLNAVPASFSLNDRQGQAVVQYSPRNEVHFDPGSCAVHILDPETLEHRPALTADLVRLVQVAEMLPQFAAQSTAVVCHDVPEVIGDIHRLHVVLLHSNKPVVSGAFSPRNLQAMIDLLAADAGGLKNLAEKPRAVFDVCPSPPLHWTEFACRCLIELGRAGIPVEMVSMPLAGATAPVTLAGSLAQHAAECLSGLTIHQLAAPGAPIIWGGAPAIFDMRSGTTPMGAIETAMLDAAYAQLGKSLDLPTHGYLGASDAKLLDAQAGMESGMTALIGALAGINMISGAGMLDFLNCQSVEKLVVDAEGIAMAQRLLKGIGTPTETLSLDMFRQIGLSGEFLKLKETRALFKAEQILPSSVIDRGSLRAWQDGGRGDIFSRARERASALMAGYQKPDLPKEIVAEFERIMQAASKG